MLRSLITASLLLTASPALAEQWVNIGENSEMVYLLDYDSLTGVGSDRTLTIKSIEIETVSTSLFRVAIACDSYEAAILGVEIRPLFEQPYYSEVLHPEMRAIAPGSVMDAAASLICPAIDYGDYPID